MVPDMDTLEIDDFTIPHCCKQSQEHDTVLAQDYEFSSESEAEQDKEGAEEQATCIMNLSLCRRHRGWHHIHLHTQGSPLPCSPLSSP